MSIFKLLRRLLALLLLTLPGAGLAQQAPVLPDSCWRQEFGVPEGPNGEVLALVWAKGNLYIGGHFTAVGGVAARNVARWDGHRWSSLGTGDDNGLWLYRTGDHPTSDDAAVVRALAVAPNGDVYAGGNFGRAGQVAARGLARWDGRRWSAVGDFLHLEEDIHHRREAQAESRWERQGSPSRDNHGRDLQYHAEAYQRPAVLTLAVTADGTVYAGGNFRYAASAYPADTLESGLACWNGTTWQVPGRGMPGSVQALVAAPDNLVYAGGDLRTTQPDVRGRVARWDGQTWTYIGTSQNYYGHENSQGIPRVVHALALGPDGTLYAAGASSYYAGGSHAADNVARWDGRYWEFLGAGPFQNSSGTVNALAVAGGRVYAAGDFQYPWPVGAPERGSRVAAWDGRTWQPLDPALPTDPIGQPEPISPVAALAVSPAGELYMGGRLLEKTRPLVGHGLARWTGQRWDYLPAPGAQGLDNEVQAVAAAPDGRIYVGGAFERAGGTRAHRLACWNGRSWEPLPAGCLAGRSGDLAIHALAVTTDGQLYASARAYSQDGQACRIARWDGRAWHPLGPALCENSATDQVSVSVLVPDARGGLYVAGHFATAGDQPTPNVAHWTGTAWEALGPGLPGWGISALALAPDGTLYAAGHLSLRPGYSEQLVMRWDGRSWSPIGSIGNGNDNCASMNSGGGVFALAVAPNGDLYAGGVFTDLYEAGVDVQARNLARWDGRAWHALTTVSATEAADNCGGNWLRHGVHCLVFAPGGTLYAAGAFEQLGGVAARRVARWDGTTWHTLGPGLNGPALTLACLPDGRVAVGGRFTAFGNNRQASAHFAIIDPAACPPAPKHR